MVGLAESHLPSAGQCRAEGISLVLWKEFETQCVGISVILMWDADARGPKVQST